MVDAYVPKVLSRRLPPAASEAQEVAEVA
jgi:hypothetical protein